MSTERSHDTVALSTRNVGRASRPSKRSPAGPAARHSSVGARSPALTGVVPLAAPPVPCRNMSSCGTPASSASSFETVRSLSRLPSTASRPGESETAVVTAALRVPESRSSSASSRYHRLRVSGRSSTTTRTSSPSADVEATARPAVRSRRSASIAAESAGAPAVCAHRVAMRAGRSGSVGITHTRRPRRRAFGTSSNAATPYEPGVSGCSSRVTDQLPAVGAGRSSKPGP